MNSNKQGAIPLISILGFTFNLVGLYTLSKREILRFFVVSHQTLFPPLISSFLFLFIFGLSIGRNIQFNVGGLSYIDYIIPGIVTMHLISASFENTTSSLFIARWHNHIQEVLLSPLSYFEMVLGLLIGGLTRGILVASGVYLISLTMTQTTIAHPVWTLYFLITISIIFSSVGLIAALWAKDFGMLSIWNIYLITPAVFLGGVFNPIQMMPESLRFIIWANPMYYLVSGMRASILGLEELPLVWSAWVALILSVGLFLLTVYLFKIGYRLRT